MVPGQSLVVGATQGQRVKLLVTGAAGMVGREVCELATHRGHELAAFTRAELDIADPVAVAHAITEARPDVVINCAAFTAVDLCETETASAYAVNETGPRNLARACRSVNARMVHISTDYVFDGNKPAPYHEADIPNPQSVYGASKLAGERAVLEELGRDVTIVRTAWVCGRYGANMVKTVMRVAGASDSPLRFVNDQHGCPTFADELASMLITLAMRDDVDGIVHVTNQGAVSWYDFVGEIIECLGGDRGRVEPITTADLQPPRPAPRPFNSVLESRALPEVGIAPLGHYRPALKRCIAAITAATLS